MNHHQGSTINALHGITTLLDAEPAFAPIRNSVARKNLDAARGTLENWRDSQGGSAAAAKQETLVQRSLRLALRDHLALIERSAKKAKLTGEVLVELSVPRGKPSAQQLLNAAAGMERVATAQSAVLIAAGAPADFLAQLQAAATAFEASLGGHTAQKTTRVTATAGLKAAVKDAVAAIGVIDLQVRKLIGSNRALLAGWETAKRITSKPGLPRGAEAAATAADAQTQAQTQAQAQPQAQVQKPPTTTA